MGAIWSQIVDELGLRRHPESDVHPHVPDERAELFRAADGGSTEYEYLNLVHALVLAKKPMLVLETGTFRGFGTVAIASALEENGVGRMVTLDLGDCVEARNLLLRYDLKAVELLQIDSIKFCGQWSGESFDFLFLDSDVSVRHRECELLRRRGKLSADALAVFHDSSPLRHGVPYSGEMLGYLTQHSRGLSFGLSRGLHVLQF